MAKKHKAKPEDDDSVKQICRNKKAYHNYEVTEKFEAGLVLVGTEVKSLREGTAHLSDAYVAIDGNEAFVKNMHIAGWQSSGRSDHSPLRTRKLLLHRREIDRLRGKIERSGFALIPLRAYFRDGRAKLELGLGRGRKAPDKRQMIRERDERRIADRFEKQKRR